VCVSYVQETGVNMTELGLNLTGPPPRTGQRASFPPDDTRLAPHSGSPGLRRPRRPRHRELLGHLRPEVEAILLDPVRPAAPQIAAAPPPRKSPSPPLGGERVGVRWGMAFNKTPHPEEAAKAVRLEGPAPAKAGDAPAPIPVIPAQAAARGLDPRARTHSPYAAATAPAPRFRGADRHCARAKTHPEN